MREALEAWEKKRRPKREVTTVKDLGFILDKETTDKIALELATTDDPTRFLRTLTQKPE